MKAYTNKDSLINYLLIDIDNSMDTQLSLWIDAMSNYIDNYCNRVLFSEEEDTFYYDGDNTDLLHIKDCCEISEVKVDGRTVTVFEYPQNKSYTSRIALKDSVFSKGLQNITVTGIQAMNSVLSEDVKFACTVLVAGIINKQILDINKTTSERIGNYQISYKDAKQEEDFKLAKQILNSYCRIAL